MKTGGRAVWLGLGLVVAFAAARGVFLAVLVPPLHGPDEPAHFDYVQRIAETGRLPEPRSPCSLFSREVAALETAYVAPIKFRPERRAAPLASVPLPDPRDPSSRATSGCGPAQFYPPLYYATTAAAYRARAGAPLLERLLAARFVSVAWGIAAAALAFFAGLWWFGTARDGVLMGLLFASQPMIGFLSSVVNNDAALFACASGSFAAIAAAHRTERKGPALVALAVCATAGVLVKPTFTFVLLPVLFLLAGLSVGPRSVRAWLTSAAALAVPAAAAIAWSLLTRDATAQVLQSTSAPISIGDWARARFHPRLLESIWVHTLWMSWGWLDTRLTPGYYAAIAATLVLAFAGLVWGWRTLERGERGLVLAAAAASVYALGVLYALDLFVARTTGMAFVQGRYLLPLFPLHAALIVIGLRAVARRLGAALDAPWAFVIVLLLVNLASALRVIERFHA